MVTYLGTYVQRSSRTELTTLMGTYHEFNLFFVTAHNIVNQIESFLNTLALMGPSPYGRYARHVRASQHTPWRLWRG